MKTAYTIDNKGNRWVWDCGWFLVDKDGHRKLGFKPLSHAVFNRKITLLDPTVKVDREVLHGMDKPGRFWRRRINREVMTHELFGSVYVLASDGCHAIVETQDGDHKKVCFENLSENIGVPLPSRRNTAARSEFGRAEKSAKATMDLVNKYLNLTKK